MEKDERGAQLIGNFLKHIIWDYHGQNAWLFLAHFFKHILIIPLLIQKLL